jgi:LPXTG-motif cell wall-anchored protein
MKWKLAITGAVLGVVMLPLAASATPPDPGHKVTLCHRTGSATNPYIVITTDIASDGYVKGGHTGHEQIGNGLGPDIIPAYEYVAKNGDVFDFPGKSLDFVFPNGETGAEVLAAGCVLTSESPTPTPTETTPPPTTPPPTTQPPRTHTPTWTPTWTPTGGATPGQHPLAMTGSDAANKAKAVAGLGALGLGSLYLARKRSLKNTN